MSNYFTADLHCGTDEIIERENRPFKNIEEFENSFIEEVNKKCKPEDMLNIIGDFINYNDNHKADIEKTFDLVKKMNCKVRLYVGNNEERIINDIFEGKLEKFRQYCKDKGFDTVREEDYISFGDKFFYINHYPKKNKNGYINLYGHVHRSCGIYKTFGLNVGIDCNWGQIWSEQDILNEWSRCNRYFKQDIDYLVR